MKKCNICEKEFKEKQKTEKYCCTDCAIQGMKIMTKKRNGTFYHPFKMRVRRQVIAGQVYKIEEYQCPVCKVWFNSYYNGYSIAGVRLHISKTGKSEAVAQALKEIKQKPHFDFWKKYTVPTNYIYNPREWKI